MTRPLLLFMILLFAYGQEELTAQPYLWGVNSTWSDAFHDWEILTEDEELSGTLSAPFYSTGNFTQWDYRLGEDSGSIRMKWKDDLNEWELRGNNRIISARTIWKNDFTEWRITSGDLRLQWHTRWGNSLETWELRDDAKGTFSVLTRYEGDPREWEIIDELDDSVSLEIKIMLMFLTLINSIP
jgi:hypothetical protein